MWTPTIIGQRTAYIKITTILLSCLVGRMSANRSSFSTEIALNSDFLRRARVAVPPLTNDLHKGQAGKIGVVGGSFEYTGAPYFAAISALRTGADLVSVFCAKDAAIPIKSYSPELMVYPIFDPSNAAYDPFEQIRTIEPQLERLDVIVIGPGLGRNPKVLDAVSQLIEKCRALKKPLVLDADATYMIAQNILLIKDYPAAIITPNAFEFDRIFGKGETFKGLEILGSNATVLRKGAHDAIYYNAAEVAQVSGGSGRRCGGQGDILSGCTAIFYAWCLQANQSEAAAVAAYAASYLVKRLNEVTFEEKGRSMTAVDMINNIGKVFRDYFES